MTKSISIKGAKRKFGGCARKAGELTPGDLTGVRQGLGASREALTAGQKSAEAIVGWEAEGPNGGGGAAGAATS